MPLEGKNLITSFKIKHILPYAFAFTVLGYVLWQLDVGMLREVWRGLGLTWLAVAWGALLLSQLVSSVRMRHYMRSLVGLSLPFTTIWRIYMRGAWMSFWLPSGIAGDGWKIWHLARQHAVNWKGATQLQLAERASGLHALILLCLMMLPFTKIPMLPAWMLLAAGLLSAGAYLVLAPRITGESRKVSMVAFLYSLLVQVLVGAMTLALALSMSLDVDIATLIWITWAAAIAASLPIAIGGIGIRELLFMKVALVLNMPPEPLVVFALLISVLHLCVALLGVKPIPVTSD